MNTPLPPYSPTQLRHLRQRAVEKAVDEAVEFVSVVSGNFEKKVVSTDGISCPLAVRAAAASVFDLEELLVDKLDGAETFCAGVSPDFQTCTSWAWQRWGHMLDMPTLGAWYKQYCAAFHDSGLSLVFSRGLQLVFDLSMCSRVGP